MLDIEIRNYLTRYLAGEISLEEFEEWFVPTTWDIHKSGNKPAEDLAGSIELLLAEFSSGHLSDDELRRELKVLIGPSIVITIGPPATPWTAGSGVSSSQFRISGQSSSSAHGLVIDLQNTR